MDYLVYVFIFGIVIPSIVQTYLYLFPLNKLYKEVCLKRENKKINFFFEKRRLSCLKMFQASYPEHAQEIKKIIKWDSVLSMTSRVSIVAVVLLAIFGVIPYMPDTEESRGKITQSLTITKVEGNETTVKTYKNFQEFLK